MGTHLRGRRGMRGALACVALVAAWAIAAAPVTDAVKTYSEADYVKMFKGIPAACAAYSDDATNDWSADDDAATACLFNCTSGEACDDPDACCTFYPSARVGGTKMSEIVALAEFALECDHHTWIDHELNWCAGYYVTGTVLAQTCTYDSTCLTTGSGCSGECVGYACCVEYTVGSNCFDFIVTDPCTGDVLQTGPGMTKDLYENSIVTSATNRMWGGVTCEWKDILETEQIVEYLRLDNTNITCDLNSTGANKLQTMTYLQEIDMGNNKLSGNLPSWLGHMGTNLVKLDVSHNNIEGTLPDEWKHAVNLADIDLAHNELTGTIPVSWFPLNSTEKCEDGWGLHKLTHLEVKYNKLVGPLPSGLRCASLTKLDIAHNHFDGDVPNFENLHSITSLHINDQTPGFSGTLPETIGYAGWVHTTDTHYLLSLAVNNNELTGTLPATISMLEALTILHMGYNNMSGYVPELPSSLDAAGTSVTFYGPNQEFWCPFPSNHHAVYDMMDCTCESAHHCPSGFDEAGYFSNEIGARIDACEHNCTLCGAGEYSNGTWNDECTRCRRGTYAAAYSWLPMSDIDQCTDCPLGTYADQLGSTSCTKCDRGTYAGTPGSALCTLCPPGTFANSMGASECTPCAAGSYSDGYGAINCTLCDAGTYQNNTGRTKCTNCTLGTYSADEGAAECTECVVGKVALEEGRTSCKQCGEGLYASEAHDSCDLCSAGTFASGGSYDRLFYDVSDDTYHQCFNCSAGTYSHSDGSTECIDCMGGSIAPHDGMSTCHKCPIGKHGHTTTECLWCLPGEHANHTGLEECDPCPEGYTSGHGAGDCDACPKGTHWESLSGDYVDHVYCDDDSDYYNTETKDCSYDGKTVEINDFLYGGWNLTCLACEPGKHANKRATVECPKCPRGHFADQWGTVHCEPCAPGSDAPKLGHSNCTLCDIGHATDTNGTVQCPACKNGTFMGERGATVCTDCAAGMYGPEEGLAACIECEPGYANPREGRAHCPYCTVGTLSQKYGAKECNLTAPGHFWVNGTTERPCTVGSFASEGDGVCTPCEKGSYAPSIATSNCTLCVAGKHLNATGSSRGCSVCPAGTHASRPGADVCDECANGTYSTGPLTAGPSAAPTAAPVSPPTSMPSTTPTRRITGGPSFAPSMSAGPVGSPTTAPISPPTVKPSMFPTAKTIVAPSFAPSTVAPTTVAPSTVAPSTSSSTSAGGRRLLSSDDATQMDLLVGDDNAWRGLSRELDRHMPDDDSAWRSVSRNLGGDFSFSYNYVGVDDDYARWFMTWGSPRLNGTIECTPCPIGMAQAKWGATGCEACSWPLLATAEGYARCAPVSAGYYWASNASELPCPTAHYSPRGETECLKCPAGTYSDTTGTPECYPCVNGTASGEGAEMCTECVEGEYAEGGTACLACPLGHYSNVKMAEECTPCPVGTYAGSEGQTGCEALPAGYASATEGAGNLSLIKCVSGYYAPNERSTECTEATPGHYVSPSETGAVEQTQCSEGTISSGFGSAACEPCEPGTIAAYRGATGCTACGGCTYAPEWGESVCVGAPAGSTPNDNRSNVIDCGVGMYRHWNDSTCSCTACHVHHYNDQERAGACVACPKSMFTAWEGAHMASMCVESGFGDDDYYGLTVSGMCNHPGGCYYGIPVLATGTVVLLLSFFVCCCCCACEQHRRSVKARKKARRKERRAARQAAAQASEKISGTNPMKGRRARDEDDDDSDDSDDSDDDEVDEAPRMTRVKLRSGSRADAPRPPPPPQGDNDDAGGSDEDPPVNPMHAKDVPKKSNGSSGGRRKSKLKPLPEGWEEHEDESTGRTYFYNAATQITTWKRPSGGGNSVAVRKPPPPQEDAV